MTTYGTFTRPLAVASALPSGTDRRQHCRLTRDLADALRLPDPLPANVLCQVRLAVTTSDASGRPRLVPFVGASANFSVAAIAPGTNQVEIYRDSDVRAGDGGEFKLFGASGAPEGELRVSLYSRAPSSTTIDGTTTSHFVEPSPASGRYFKEYVRTHAAKDLLLLAAHGGSVEEETSELLEALKDHHFSFANTWQCKGEWGSGTHRRWHVTTTGAIHPRSFPGLGLLEERGPYQNVLSLHGFAWGDEDARPRRGLIIGGRAPMAHKDWIRYWTRLLCGHQVAVFVASPNGDHLSYPGEDGDLATFAPASHAGLSTYNLANRLAATGGLHVEVSQGLRDDGLLYGKFGAALAEALLYITEEPLSAPSSLTPERVEMEEEALVFG